MQTIIITHIYNLISKPQLRSYVTGRFRIKGIPQRPVRFGSYSAFNPALAALLYSVAGPGEHQSRKPLPTFIIYFRNLTPFLRYWSLQEQDQTIMTCMHLKHTCKVSLQFLTHIW